jgi:DNA-binding MarR family transcriptional regulator
MRNSYFDLSIWDSGLAVKGKPLRISNEKDEMEIFWLTIIVLYSTIILRTLERVFLKIITQTQGGFLISQLSQVQNRIFEKLLKNYGIDDFNGPQGRILFVLWQDDGLPISEIGQRTSLSKSTLTSMLDRMEKQGHLQRNYDPKDRRQIRITLTEKAKALNQKYLEVSLEMTRIFYQGFSGAEIAVFEKMLAGILNNLQQYERG